MRLLLQKSLLLGQPRLLCTQTKSTRIPLTLATKTCQNKWRGLCSWSNSKVYNNRYNGDGAGPNVMGSGIGSDSSMIAANDRMFTSTASSLLHPQLFKRQQQQQKQQTRFMSSSSSTSNNNTETTTTKTAKNDDGMKDEYGEMTDEGETFVKQNFGLENGIILPEAQLRYRTYGTLNPETRDNVLVVCHALTGNASLHSWWGDLLGPGRAFDTSKYLVVCCNILGSCYGSTSPQSINPHTGRAYGLDFPDISVKDTVKLQLHLLMEELNLSSVKCVIGGSFGGMQAVEFAVQGGRKGGDFMDKQGNPFIKAVIPIACGAYHTSWQIAISEVQRQAIYADPQWKMGNPEQALDGLAVARQIGMISYRTHQAYQGKFGRKLQPNKDDDDSATLPAYGSQAHWATKSYLEYQGQKFLTRFDPITYVKMTEQMDSHDVSRGRADNVRDVLQTVQIPSLVMGIDSDVLYPVSEQEELADALSGAQLQIISSPEGHDGFLLEQDQVADKITTFLNNLE